MEAGRSSAVAVLVTGVLLAIAWSLNLWVGNRLWLGYTTFGMGVFAALVGLARVRRWEVPARAWWIAGVASALHFLGGSLSGLHTIGGPNGLYYVFPWWDNAVHFLGALAAAAVAHAVLEARRLGRWLGAFLAVCVATFLGVLVELYEFANFLLFGTVDQGFYTNTLLDLYYNLLGAGAGAYLHAASRRLEPGPGSAPPSAPPPVS